MAVVRGGGRCILGRMKLEIRTYGDPVLLAETRRVGAIDANVRKLVADMIDTMRAEQGVGLAAPQVGASVSICVVEVPPDLDMDDAQQRIHPDLPMPLVLINPNIVYFSKKTVKREEGCLSFPEIRGDIPRSVEIEVEFKDLDGAAHKLRLREFVARVVQHEVDHLHGALFIERMSLAKKLALKNALKRLKSFTEEHLVAAH